MSAVRPSNRATTGSSAAYNSPVVALQSYGLKSSGITWSGGSGNKAEIDAKGERHASKRFALGKPALSDVNSCETRTTSPKPPIWTIRIVKRPVSGEAFGDLATRNLLCLAGCSICLDGTFGRK